MRTKTEVVLAAIALSAAVFGLAACADDGYYGTSYGYGYDYGYPYYGYGPYASAYYDDCFGPYYSAYCGYPVFSGGVVIGGRSYRNLHYRDGARGREFWSGRGWRRPDSGTFRSGNRVTASALPPRPGRLVGPRR